MLIVLTTTANLAEAEDLAQKIIEAKLAACVQVLPHIISFYSWENSIQKDSEFLLIIKTLSDKYSKLEKFIQVNHSYETPEIVALQPEKVSASYLKWLTDYLET